jgi:hypothetical protein
VFQHAERGKAFASMADVSMVTYGRVDEALSRLKGRFLEVPTTCLSVQHASRLTGLDDATCLALLLALERGKFLRRTRAGDFLLYATATRDEL